MSFRIRLVEPRPADHNVYDIALLPRLGLPLMGRLLADAGHDVRVYCELLEPLDLEDCLGADLVGISTTTSTSPAAYRLADFLGASGVPVVLGGPHVTFCADEALEHAPYVVRGEGEATICELVSALERGTPLAGVLGLSFADETGQLRHNAARPRCDQAGFEALPAPDLRLIAGHERMVTKPLITQWGCPFDCEFCSVTAMFSRSVRYRRPEQVVSELAALSAERVFFHDDNFVVSKPRTTRLLQQMLEADLVPDWFAQLRANSALRAHGEVDHELLSLMRRSGCRMVMLGIEAITDEALEHVGKRQRVSTVEAAVRAFHEHGIAVHGMFVAGLDTDTAASAGETATFARDLGIDTFQLMVETPLPGTRLWDRVSADARLLSDEWSLFDGHHVVMRPANMSPLELQLSVLDAMRRFYSWPSIVASGLVGALRHLPDLAVVARPDGLRHLPALARTAWAREWGEARALLEQVLPPHARRRLSGALWLPALRFYARRQLSGWRAEQSSREHIELLASLS